MIGWLSGVVKRRAWPIVVVDVSGIGYELQVPLGTYERITREGEEIELEVLTLFRAEALQLYGFSSLEEKQVFETLLGVSGVGPRLALAILSGLSPSALATAVRDEKPQLLETIPGIGRKTAQRLALELRDKLDKIEIMQLESLELDESSAHGGASEDAVAALENLGFKKSDAAKAVSRSITAESTDDLPALIRKSLGYLRMSS